MGRSLYHGKEIMREGKKNTTGRKTNITLQASIPCEHVSGTTREEGSREKITEASSGRRRKEE